MQQGCMRCGGGVLGVDVDEDGDIRRARVCSACGCDQDFPGRAPTAEERRARSASARSAQEHIGYHGGRGSADYREIREARVADAFARTVAARAIA